MKVHLRQIPAEGLHLEGEEDCLIPDLTNDEVQCDGPLRYSLEVGLSEGALWANGSLAQPVVLRCVACLERFPYTIAVPEFALVMEAGGPELVDLAPAAREDILLNLPAYPRCDKHGGRVCPAPPLQQNHAAESETERKPDWSALDKLDL
ncbi:MAG: YceD family protein [Chthoniobacterales bacterium]